MHRRVVLAVFSSILGIALLRTGAPAGVRPGGFYTKAQATTGAALYAARCSRCHGADLRGGPAPALVGPAVKGRWPVKTLYAFVSKQMPANARGRLRSQEYDAVVAFLLSRNGHVPGRTALTRATAATIGEKL